MKIILIIYFLKKQLSLSYVFVLIIITCEQAPADNS